LRRGQAVSATASADGAVIVGWRMDLRGTAMGVLEWAIQDLNL
jgi:hypothetical protein